MARIVQNAKSHFRARRLAGCGYRTDNWGRCAFLDSRRKRSSSNAQSSLRQVPSHAPASRGAFGLSYTTGAHSPYLSRAAQMDARPTERRRRFR